MKPNTNKKEKEMTAQELGKKLFSDAPEAFGNSEYSALKWAEAFLENRPGRYDLDLFEINASDNTVDVFYNKEQIDYWNL